MFKKLFGSSNKAEPASKLAAVRNITVGRTVSLDPLAWRRLGEETRFALDRDVLDISAQGLISLESGQFVHRFYTDDHVMLQAMSDDEAGLENYDFSLFVPWTSAYPPGERERRVWRDRLSAPVFHGAAEDLPDYPRFWFSESDAIQPPVTLWDRLGRPDRDQALRQDLPDLYAVCAGAGGRARTDDRPGAAARGRRDDA